MITFRTGMGVGKNEFAVNHVPGYSLNPEFISHYTARSHSLFISHDRV
jgi:hypothetical protein